ncbi:MAG: flavodoxin family protein, partial [Alphaproteobacteria bacterium]
MTRSLLVVAHAPSPNTKRLFDAVLAGAGENDGVEIIGKTPFQAGPDEILAADGIILGTTENLG